TTTAPGGTTTTHPGGTTTTAPAGAPAITTDAAQYATGATVTYTGTGWTGCANIKLDVFGPGGSTVATGITPAGDGTFSGTFTAPGSPGTDLLFAQGAPHGPSCQAFTTFDVVPI